jgi:hypothetical protein
MRRDHLLVFQDDLVVGVVHGLSDSVVGVGGQDVVQGGPKREDRLHGFRLGGRDQVGKLLQRLFTQKQNKIGNFL